MKAIIWCEVTCNDCGETIGFNYKNSKTISALKKQQIIGNIVEKKVIFAKIAIKSRKILTDKTLTEYRILQTASNGGFLFTISTKYMLLLRLFLIK